MFVKILTKKVEAYEFIKFWSSFYNYTKEDFYLKVIDKKSFSSRDILNLFVWKNGGKLSKAKRKAVAKIIGKVDIVNRLKSEFCLETFNYEFNFISGMIWKIYLLHIINPNKYPIFDQHVCRAYYFLNENTIKEIPSLNKEKERFYFDKYAEFFNRFTDSGISRKKLDEALWAFGKFLKTPYNKITLIS